MRKKAKKTREEGKTGVKPRTLFLLGGALAGIVVALIVLHSLMPGLPRMYSYIPADTSFVIAFNEVRVSPETEYLFGDISGEVKGGAYFEHNKSLFFLIETKSRPSDFFSGCAEVKDRLYDCYMNGEMYAYDLDPNVVLISESMEPLEGLARLYPLKESFNPPHPEVMAMPAAEYVDVSGVAGDAQSEELAGALGDGSALHDFTRFMTGMSEHEIKVLAECKDEKTAEYYEKHPEEISSPEASLLSSIKSKSVRREGRWVIITYEGSFQF